MDSPTHSPSSDAAAAADTDADSGADAAGAAAPAAPSPQVNATRWIAVGSVLALIALGLAWELGIARSLWAVKVLPLCIPLAGLLKLRLYTYRWTSMLVWLYIAEGAVRLRDGGVHSALAGLEIVLGIALFAACAAHVRLRLRRSP